MHNSNHHVQGLFRISKLDLKIHLRKLVFSSYKSTHAVDVQSKVVTTKGEILDRTHEEVLGFTHQNTQGVFMTWDGNSVPRGYPSKNIIADMKVRIYKDWSSLPAKKALKFLEERISYLVAPQHTAWFRHSPEVRNILHEIHKLLAIDFVMTA